MAQNKRNAPAAVVREWLNSDKGTAAIAKANEKDPKVPTVVGARGRIHPAHSALFNKAHKGLVHETGSEAEKPTVTVPVVTVDSAGRKTTRPVTVTTAEARALIGAEGKSGRLSYATLSEALSAKAAAEVADQFTADAA